MAYPDELLVPGVGWADRAPVSTVQFRHTVLDRVPGCGTLVIESASDEPMEFRELSGVERVHAVLCREAAGPGGDR